MAISAQKLNTAIKDAMNKYNNAGYKDSPNTPQHLKILGDTMKDYFENNIEIIYGWSAVLPPPASTPDPVVTFDSTVKFPSFDLTLSVDLNTLAVFIQTAFIGAIINHASGFVVTPGTFLVPVFPVLGRIADSAQADTAIYSCICVPVCAWVLTLINPAPLEGAHSAYTGATTGMVIT